MTPPVNLTAKQQTIVDLVTRGYTNKEIGAQMGLSPRTIEDYKCRIYRKYGVHKAVDLVRKIFA